MKAITVKVITQLDEMLELKAIDRDIYPLITILEDGYALSGYTLYKRKGNVICGERIETKQLIIQIDEVNE